MIEFVLAVVMVLGILFIGGCFMGWVAREHRIANKYRYLLRLHKEIPKTELARAIAHTNKAPAPTKPIWEVTYRKGKIRKEILEGETEGDVVRQITGKRDYKEVENIRKL